MHLLNLAVDNLDWMRLILSAVLGAAAAGFLVVKKVELFLLTLTAVAFAAHFLQ